MKNRVFLIGRMGAAAECRSTQAGDKVANFTLATSKRWTDKEGNKQEQVEWHRIECWKGLADVIEKYTDKGSLIDIEGELKTEKWADKDGNDRYTTKIRATNIILLDAKKEDSQQPQAGSQQSSAPTSNPAGGSGQFSQADEDDLPF